MSPYDHHCCRRRCRLYYYLLRLYPGLSDVHLTRSLLFMDERAGRPRNVYMEEALLFGQSSRITLISILSRSRLKQT